MLACIACSKHDLEDGEEDAARGATNPSNKEAVKSLTSQIKDMVLKFSGSYRQCKGGSSSCRSKSFNNHRCGGGGGGCGGGYLHDDAVSEASGHRGQLHLASSSSTPAWDFLSVNEESRYKAQWIHGAGMGAAEAALEDVVVLENSREPREWMAQVEPGVHITFVSLPGGAGNDLKRIRFSREMFNKWQAQRWWGENYDRIMELYNVQRFNRQALSTPPRSDDGCERESFCSRVGSTRESPVAPPVARFTYRPPPPPPSGKGVYFPTVPDPSEHLLPYHFLHSAAAGVSGVKGETSSVEASRTTTSSRDEASVSISNASELEVTEWVEQDEPGVYITIRELADGTRELRRVRFSRERFGEVHAKLWWEENRERIQAQYL